MDVGLLFEVSGRPCTISLYMAVRHHCVFLRHTLKLLPTAEFAELDGLRGSVRAQKSGDGLRALHVRHEEC